MLTIRLRRKGKKNQPFFRVVLIDKKRSAKGGKAVEILGNVDPLTKRKNFKKERILYWISKGAQPTATVHNLLVSEKIIEGAKIHVSRIKKTAEAPEKTPLTTSEPVAPAENKDLAPEPAAEEPKAEEKAPEPPAPAPEPALPPELPQNIDKQ